MSHHAAGKDFIIQVVFEFLGFLIPEVFKEVGNIGTVHLSGIAWETGFKFGSSNYTQPGLRSFRALLRHGWNLPQS